MLVNVYNGTAIGNHSDSLCHKCFCKNNSNCADCMYLPCTEKCPDSFHALIATFKCQSGKCNN